MKIKCDFCKTEYNLAQAPTTSVRCAVCGHVWVPAVPNGRRATLTFIAALCALLSAIVFTVAVVARHRMDNMITTPLVAELIAASPENDDAGTPHFVVHGRIRNLSDEIYGVPDIVVTSRDARGNPIAAQRVMPPATLLDAGASVEFTQRLTAPVAGVKKITIELQNTVYDK